MFSLLLTMIPALLISITFDYYFVYSQNMQSLQITAEKKMDQLVKTLKKPLWQYNIDFLQDYANVMISDPGLSSIEIFDERDRNVANASSENAIAQENITWKLERSVTLEGRKIGDLVVEFNNSEMRRLSSQMLLSDVLVILAILFSVGGVIWVLITRHVLIPLKIMKESFHSISKGDYSKRVRLDKDNELTSIASEFNSMVGKVQSRDKALRENEVKYRNLVESPSDIIFTTDNSDNIVFLNENFTKWTGFAREDLVGKHFSKMFEDVDNSDGCNHLATPGKESGLYEKDLICSDLTTIPVELNISIQYDSKNRTYGAIGIARDITSRKQAEVELRKYEQMVSAISDYLLLVDHTYTIQAVNSAYLRDVSKGKKDLIGSQAQSIFSDNSYLEDFLPYLDTCFEGTNVKHQAMFTLDGCSSAYMVVTFYPIFEEDMSVPGVIVHMRDVTEQKKLEAMLNQSQKMEAIGTMAGGIAHDFNNIIGGIVGYAEMIEMFDAKESSRLATRIHHVLKGAYRAKDLVEQILTFSRSSDSKKRPLHLEDLVTDTLQFMRASIPSTIEIVKEVNSIGNVVWADETSIQQVLMNLCTNASHAMPEGGKLLVQLSVEQIDPATAEKINVQLLGPYVKLTIADSGIGMSSSTVERIFEPFYTTKKTGEGTGMGLAMVHGIIKNLRGSIVVESTIGEGSIFEVYLPQYDLTNECVDDEEQLHGEISQGQGRILFVDDEPELLGFSCEILEHLGFQVVSTTSSVEARQIFLNDPSQFDLVITDQTMPNITGIDLAKQFLQAREDIIIILCTGYSEEVTKEKAKDIGIKRFIKKPYGARQIVDLVKLELGEK